MKIVAVVPIKLNSTRLPNKNIKSFTNGKPLITYILDTLLKVMRLDEIYVYCSDERIKAYLPEGVRYLKRSESLDQDSTKINEVLNAFANDVSADIYLMTHATAPFISADKISEGLEKVLSGEFDSSFAVEKIQDFIWNEEKTPNYDLTDIPRTQDLPYSFMETSSFYIYKKEHIIDENRRIGTSPYFVEVSKIEAIDIDEAEDFELADAVYNFILKGKRGES